jgi:hypothetical protein
MKRRVAQNGRALPGAALLALIWACGGSPVATTLDPKASVSDHDALRLVDASSQAIVRAAGELIAALPADKRAALVQPFDHPLRTRAFCYVLAHCKDQHAGLRMRDLTASARIALNTLLVNALSSAGYHKAVAIMNRKLILEEMAAAHRQNPAKYTVTGCPKLPDWEPPPSRGARDFHIAIFGEPESAEPWGLRFEGHHLSVNLSFGRKDGRLAVGVAPLFMVASPMIIPTAPGDDVDAPRWKAEEGQQLLRRETLLGRAFVVGLTAKVRDRGKWSGLPPAELHGGTDQDARPGADRDRTTPGIAVARLSAQSRAQLMDFVGEFLENHHPNLVDWHAFWHELSDSRVWWFGDIQDPQQEFYIRVEGPRYLIELLQSAHYGLNSEVPANHVHIAFRDLINDWDFDVLGEHVKRHHH